MIEIQGPDAVERKPVKKGEAKLGETPAEQSDSKVEEIPAEQSGSIAEDIPAEQSDIKSEAALSGQAAAESEDGFYPELFQSDCHDPVSEPETAERLDGEEPSDSGCDSATDAGFASGLDSDASSDPASDADPVAGPGRAFASDPGPDRDFDSDPAASPHAYDAERLAALLPGPASDAHKYSRGKLVVIGGAAAYPGAACLAAAASQRMGAGYTEVLCAPESVSAVRAFRPSLVVRSWEALAPAFFVAARPGRPVAYAVGSGFDAADDASEAKRLVHRALKHAHAPLLVDGGGLAMLASDKGRRLMRRRFVNGWPTVITPHAGEAARLAAPLELPTDDQGELARLLALAYGAIAVVKGPDTFISDGDEVVRVGEGTAALAKAGTGDVLAGMLGALLAQGLDPLDASVLAVTLHARAGRIAADRLTAISVIAEDVVAMIPAAIRSVADKRIPR